MKNRGRITATAYSIGPFTRKSVAALSIALLLLGDVRTYLFAQEQDNSQQQGSPQQQGQSQEASAKLPSDQLNSLVAPIALYPDPLLSQLLVASTYPLEIIQLQQWIAKNKDLKGEALTKAVEKQNWDASVQALVLLPDVLKQLADNIKWTTDLGNAFLAQQGEVMDAVQRMRAKAQESGNLKSNDKQKVETQNVDNKEVIVIQPASTQVVYVPTYNPTVVFGPPLYPYPPIYYPPPGYYAAGMAVSFGVGMAMGAAMSGGWGWGCSWGHSTNVYVNRNNTFVNNSYRNYQGGNRTQFNSQGRGTWQHNPQHRGGAPYADRATANQFGGANRQNQNLDRGSLDNARSGSGNIGANRDFSGASGGDRIGDRSISNSPSSRGSGAFGGGGGFDGGAARSSSFRGGSSMGGGGFGGGGRMGGGGFRGGRR